MPSHAEGDFEQCRRGIAPPGHVSGERPGRNSRRQWFFPRRRWFTVIYSTAATADERYRIRTVTERARRTPQMRRPERLAFVTAALAALLALPGCATMNVSSHIERGVDFAQFRTWDFGPADALPTGDPRLDNNPFFKDYLEGAVGKELEARHYARATSGTPDLLVHYHANISKTFDINGVDSRYGYCYDNCEPRFIEYEQGTIVLDVVDTRTNRVVWRGWAQDSIDG